MSLRQQIFDWFEQGAVAPTDQALEAAGLLPSARHWRNFLDHLLLWSGAVALAAAMVLFIAYNWSALGKFAKFGLVGLPIVLAVIGYWKLGVDRAAGKASLLAASILLGVLLALFGQTYQTGADTWQLFATWAALMMPWVIIGRFAALWMLWIAIANLAIVLYFQVIPDMFGLIFNTDRQLWVLFLFNSTLLVCWEFAARSMTWLNERWACRLLAIAGGTTVTLLMLHAIFEWRESGIAVLIAYPAWLACAYGAYRVWKRDVFVLAGGCLSVIVVVASFLTRHMMRGNFEAGALLIIGLLVIGMASAAGVWLKNLANEEAE